MRLDELRVLRHRALAGRPVRLRVSRRLGDRLMSIFLIDWADRVSLIIDDVDEQHARQVALEESGGIPPTKVRRLPPRVLVCELFAEDGVGKGAPDVIVLRALPHVLDVLGALLEDEQPMPAPSHLRVVGPCPSIADDSAGKPVTCELLQGHTGVHARGELAWGDT